MAIVRRDHPYAHADVPAGDQEGVVSLVMEHLAEDDRIGSEPAAQLFGRDHAKFSQIINPVIREHRIYPDRWYNNNIAFRTFTFDGATRYDGIGQLPCLTLPSIT